MGHRSLQVPAIPLPLPTPAPVQPLHPQLLLGLAHGQVGGGMGRGYPETKLEASSASQLGPLEWGGGLWSSLILYWGLRVGVVEGPLENVFKTIKLWTFGCGDRCPRCWVQPPEGHSFCLILKEGPQPGCQWVCGQISIEGLTLTRMGQIQAWETVLTSEALKSQSLMIVVSGMHQLHLTAPLFHGDLVLESSCHCFSPQSHCPCSSDCLDVFPLVAVNSSHTPGPQ